MNLQIPPWRYALCNEMFEDWPLEKIAGIAADLGYQGLELAPYTLCDYVTNLSTVDRTKIRRTIEGAGLSVVGLHWLLAKTEGLQLNDIDPDIRERTAQYLLALIDCCADIGGEVLIFGSPQQRDVPPNRSYDEAWKTSIELLYRCGERARERGVIFCLEPLSTKETNFLTKVDEAADLVRAVDHPGLQMMVDVKAMAQDPRPIADQISLVHPHFQHVHVNDPNLLGPGMGDVDFQPILSTLSKLNFSKWLSVEVFDFTPGAEYIARESIQNLIKAQQ